MISFQMSIALKIQEVSPFTKTIKSWSGTKRKGKQVFLSTVKRIIMEPSKNMGGSRDEALLKAYKSGDGIFLPRSDTSIIPFLATHSQSSTDFFSKGVATREGRTFSSLESVLQNAHSKSRCDPRHLQHCYYISK